MVAFVVFLLLAPPRHWVSHQEVYGLASDGEALYAATSGGALLRSAGSGWVEVAPLPSVPVSLMQVRDGGVVLRDSLGAWVTLDPAVASSWRAATPLEGLPTLSPPKGSGGAFLSAAAGPYTSFWGASHLYKGDQPALSRAPGSGDYALCLHKGELYAGTDTGLFVRHKDWEPVALPAGLPFARVQGLARLPSGKWLVAGIHGASIGRPGKWEKFSNDAVRQVLRNGDDTWMLFGSGAVAKLDREQRYFFDVLHDAKRPWASCVVASSDRVLFGGHGGWVEKSATGMIQHWLPELAGDVVTCLGVDGDTTWVGTQKHGLFSYRAGKLQAHSGTDSWITAVLPGDEMLVGTASSGLFRLRSGRFDSLETPSAESGGSLGSANASWLGETTEHGLAGPAPGRRSPLAIRRPST